MTESAYAIKAASKLPHRTLLLGGDFFTGSVLAAALANLVLRFAKASKDKVASNTLWTEVRVIQV